MHLLIYCQPENRRIVHSTSKSSSVRFHAFVNFLSTWKKNCTKYTKQQKCQVSCTCQPIVNLKKELYKVHQTAELSAFMHMSTYCQPEKEELYKVHQTAELSTFMHLSTCCQPEKRRIVHSTLNSRGDFMQLSVWHPHCFKHWASGYK